MDKENAGRVSTAPTTQPEIACETLIVEPVENLIADLDLYNQLKRFIYGHSDLPDERYYDLLTCYVLLTKRLGEFRQVPYLQFLGPVASGKSTAMGALCAVTDSVRTANITPASLFHVIQEKHPDLVAIDESELIQGKAEPEMIALLNSGYDRGTKAIRLQANSKGEYEIMEYDVFCPKIMAGTKPFYHETINSRSIILHMERRTRKVNFDLDEVQAEKLKHDLDDYASRWRDRKSAKIFIPEDWGSDRLAQLMRPLYLVAPSIEVENLLKSLAIEMAKRRRIEESSGIEALILQAFDAQFEAQGTLDEAIEAPLTAPFKAVYESFKDLLVAEQGEEALEFWSAQRFWRMAIPLGFEHDRVNTCRNIKIDRARYKRLLKRYLPLLIEDEDAA